MPPPPVPWSPTLPVEAELACMTARTPQGDGSPTIGFNINHFGTTSLLHMPVEIIENILFEWANLEWFAPAIARRICRHLKRITDLSPSCWSRLSLHYHSSATAEGVSDWLTRAKAAPKEISIDTEKFHLIMAALDGCKDATSIIYRTPMLQDLSYCEQMQIRLPEHMPRLRHLHLDFSNVYEFAGLCDIFEFYNAPYQGHFPCLTTLQLIFVDLIDFHVAPGLFPTIRNLSLESVNGPILDLIEACSSTLEDLRVCINYAYHYASPLHGRIILPNLKVLIIENASRIAPCFDAPTLRLLHASFDELDGNITPFNSVVEWVTRRTLNPRPPAQMVIVNLLNGMSQLQHLMLCEPMETLRTFFELLRDSRSTCPYLQSIEVVETTDTISGMTLDTNFKESLRACVAWRAEKVPGFTVQFVEDRIHVGRFEKYFTIDAPCNSFEEAMSSFETGLPLSLRV